MKDSQKPKEEECNQECESWASAATCDTAKGKGKGLPEKSKIDVTEFRRKKEEFLIFAFIGLVLLGIEILLRHTLLRTIP